MTAAERTALRKAISAKRLALVSAPIAPDPRRRVYTSNERVAALFLIRRLGLTEASRSLGIPYWTLVDWQAQERAGAA